jgi:hypothetical protein
LRPSDGWLPERTAGWSTTIDASGVRLGTPAGGDPVSTRDRWPGKADDDIVSGILGAAILAFVGIASGVLLWEGLAVATAHGHAGPDREVRRARARMAVGVLGLAIVLWIGLGIITHAW